MHFSKSFNVRCMWCAVKNAFVQCIAYLFVYCANGVLCIFCILSYFTFIIFYIVSFYIESIFFCAPFSFNVFFVTNYIFILFY